MCGIAGLVSRMDRDLGPILQEMLGAMHHRGPDGAGYVIGESCERKHELSELDFKRKRGRFALGHVRLAITGGSAGLQPFLSKDGSLSLLHNGEIYNYREIAAELGGDEDLSTGSDSEVLMRLIEREYDGSLSKTLERVLPKLDGVYALAVNDRRETVIARDKIGVRQLYYHRHDGLTSFASEKKPLWGLMDSDIEIERVLPGEMIVLTPDRFERRRFWHQQSIRPDKHLDGELEALRAYGKAIEQAVEKRVRGREHVGIIYSGGIDSVLIAYLVQRSGVPFTCYTAGREDSTDTIWARRTADRFGFPLDVWSLTDDEIERMIPEIIDTIEDQSLNQVEVAIPVFASIRRAQEGGELVILTGQGADELFGGYPWYAAIVDREGYGNFIERSWEDTFLLYKECLEREDKIAMAHSLELRVPFLDPVVIELAFSLDPSLKIAKGGDTLRKRIHRSYCRSIGIPEDVASRSKEAAQHGANVHGIFEELALRNGLSAALLDKTDYDPEVTIAEKLGSSSRYGFRYGDDHLWKPLPHVQFYLDQHAERLGVLSRLPRYHIYKVREQLAELGVENAGGEAV